MLERRSLQERGSERLGVRRRRLRRYFLYACGVVALLLLVAAMWGLWQPAVRISNVLVFGTDADLGVYARNAMQGAYLWVVPRDSIFFMPEASIRESILVDHPELAAVSIARNGFDGLSIKAEPRVAVARWCGLSPTPDVEEYCYVFDGNGYIFAAAHTMQTLNAAQLYAPLAGNVEEPLGATVAHAERLPSVFDFARQLGTLGPRVSAIIVRDDEVDDVLVSGTRITYVLGHEQSAFTALVSAKDKLNLTDGSIEYIDLRFDGKMYLKRKNEDI